MATYYIDPTGRDQAGRDGTSLARAWRSLAYACSRVITSGNIIHVNTGTYTETVQSVLRVGVSIEGEGNGSYIISIYTGIKGTILAESGAADTNGLQHISGLRMNGSSYTAYSAIQIAYRSNVQVYNCYIYDFSHYGISFLGGEPPSTYKTLNQIHDCTISNCSMYASGNTGCIRLTGQDGILIYNNTITANRADYNNGDCIYAVDGYLKNCKIYNNTINKVFVPGTTYWDFALELWNLQGGNEIYGNTINGSIDFTRASKGTSTYSVWVHHNRIGQSTLLGAESLRGILLEINMADVIIEKNYIYNVASGIYLQQGGGAYAISNIRISYNILNNIGATIGDTGWGIHNSYESDRGDDTFNNIDIWNNVIIAATIADTFYGIWIPDAGTTIDVSIRNNIVIGFTRAAVYANGTGGTTIATLSIENNIFYGNGNSNDPRYVSITPSGNTTANNLKVDPLFVSATNFYLQAGSPAINTGITVGLTTDYDNKAVSNPPEIGAYEYTATADFTNALRLATYRGYTATQLKTRASIPGAADMNIGATYIDCVNITTTKVETALGVSNHDVAQLCRHANVNKWSAFSPYWRDITGGVLTHHLADYCQLGDFGGYNHNALAPYMASADYNSDVTIASGLIIHFNPQIYIGELKYVGGDIQNSVECCGICLAVYESSVLRTYSIVNLATATSTIQPDATIVASGASKIYICKIYLVDETSYFDDTTIVGKISELGDYYKRVIIT